MKKFALLVFLALLVQEGKSQLAWDSLGAGLPATNGTYRTWQIDGRIFSSTTDVYGNLYEFSQGQWSQKISSSSTSQILDIVFDSNNNRAIILGKFGDLIGPVNSVVCNGTAIWDFATDSIFALGVGIGFPAEYTYAGMFSGSTFYVIGRFNLILNNDTIINIMRVDLQTGAYSKVCSVYVNNLIRDIVVFNGDTIVCGSFVSNGAHYPLAKITSLGLDFSVSGPYRGFSHSMTLFGDKIVFAGSLYDTSGNQNLIGSYNGNSFVTLGQTNGVVWSVNAFNGNVFAGGTFSNITDSFGVSISVNNLARLQGTWDDVLGGCSGLVSSSVSYLYPTDDTLYVSGFFDQSGSVSTLNVSRLVLPLPNSISEYNGNDTGLNLYPNPTNGHFTVSFEGILDKDVLFEIFDIEGRVVRKFISDLPAVVQVELPNGVYILKIEERVIRFVVRN